MDMGNKYNYDIDTNFFFDGGKLYFFSHRLIIAKGK